MIQINPEIDSSKLDEPLVLDQGLLDHFKDDKLSVSLKYYKKSCECFQVWKKQELKGFSNLVEKLGNSTISQVKPNTKLCHAHLGRPAKNKFSRPDDIGEDIQFYSLRVTDKARIHGFFVDPIFFLVWLDRNHECLKC